MTDEVSYTSEVSEGLLRGGGVKKNIFADFPFVFPESTPSGKIISEKVESQTYSGSVEVPNNCKACFVMFKMSYHPNWTVKLDGNSIEKYAVFPFYLAVPVPAGNHTVEFTYQPNKLKVILLILEAIIIGIVVIRKGGTKRYLPNQ